MNTTPHAKKLIHDAEAGDADENHQLLCNHCNSKKGKRSMEYLVAELKAEGTR